MIPLCTNASLKLHKKERTHTNDMYPQYWTSSIGGIFISWAGAFFTYGFGELIENTEKICNGYFKPHETMESDSLSPVEKFINDTNEDEEKTLKSEIDNQPQTTMDKKQYYIEMMGRDE